MSQAVLLAAALLQNIPSHHLPVATTQSLISWTAGPVRCANGEAIATPPRRPWGQLMWGMPPLRPVTIRFAIDVSGRTHSVRRDVSDAVAFGIELEPTLAATQFESGAPKTDCSITYEPKSTPLGQAPVPDLMSYSITPLGGRLPQEGWDRIRAPGNCLDAPPPQPLVRVLPDFSTIPATPGVKDWSMVDYDTDEDGRPVRAVVSHGTGNKALDEASVTAIKQSRFTGGARTGCRYPFWTRAAKLEASAIPDDVAAPPQGATCKRPYSYAAAPRLTYPEPYRRRMIEGWAVVSFDVAPWGDIGNVKVVASQPTEEFGTHAVRVMRTARFNPAPSGMSGCIERVIFKLGPDGTKPLEGAEPNPVY